MNPPKKKRFAKIVGWFLIVFGLFFGLAALADTKDPETEKVTVPMTVIGLVIAGTGVFMIVRAHRTDRAMRITWQEKAVLGVASRNSGRLTLAQISLETDLSTSEAEEVLSRLSRQNLVQPELLDDGSVEYRVQF